MENKGVSLKAILVLLYLIGHTHLFSIDSLLLVQKTNDLKHSQGLPRVQLLGELSLAIQDHDNYQAEQYALEGINLAYSLGDSIEYYKISSTLASIYNKNGKFEKCYHYQSKVIPYYKRNQDTSSEAKALNKLGAFLTNFGKYQYADSMLVIALSIYNQIGDEKGIMNTELHKGLNYLDWDKYSLAEASFNEALKISTKLQDTLTTSKLWNNLGFVARRMGNYDEALEYYFKAANSHLPNDLFKAKIFNNIGIIYKIIESYDKSLKYYLKALEIKEQLDLKKSMSYTLHNIGTLYKNKMDYGKALIYLNRSLEIKKKLDGTNLGVTKTINNIGGIHLLLGDYNKAEEYYKQHLDFSISKNNETETSRALNNLSACSLKQKEYNKAVTYGLKSYEIAQRINYPKIIRSSAQNLAESYKALNDPTKSLLYQNRYWSVNDSLVGGKSRKKIAEIEYQYELSQKEKKAKLENEKLILSEVEKNNDRSKIFLLGLLLIISFAFLFIIFYRLYKNRSKLRESQNQWSLKLDKQGLENKLLQEKIIHQKLQLDMQSSTLQDKNKKISRLEDKITKHPVNEQPILLDLNSFLNNNIQTEKDWKDFKHHFSAVHKDFFKILKSKCPKLTSYDLNLCAFIKLNLHNKEIAQILGISPLSVKKARQRLYRKMNKESNEDLVNYIIQI